MATLGDMLRSAREARGVSLAEAERETKIRQKYISALEDDNPTALPGVTYARGFLRNYASYLDLDVEEVTNLYDEQRLPTRDKLRAARGEPAARAAVRPDAEKISIQPLSNERIDTRVRYGTQYIALSLLAIPLIIIFYFVYSAAAGPKNQGVPIPTFTVRPPTVTSMPVGTVVVGGPATGEFNTPTVFVPATPVSGVITVTGTVTTSAAVTTTAVPSAGIPSADTITVKVTTTRDAWMSVLVDGVQQFSGTLAKGATRQWKGKNTIQVRTGRADSVEVEINGVSKGFMGTPNNLVVEKKWDRTGKETVIQP
ncbi:MAG: RodZ domain-containing protein [Chloroflexota bacterium]